MTSNNSSIKSGQLLRHNLKSYWWLILINFIVLAFIGPIFLLMDISSTKAHLLYAPELQLKIQASITNFIISGGVLAKYLTAMAAAAVIAIVMFNFLNHKRQVNFYHSLPISRGKLFLEQYLLGILIFLVPFVLMLLLEVIIGAANGADFGLIAKEMLFHFGRILLFFWITYSIVILAMQLTSTTLTNICMSVMLFFGPLALYWSSVGFWGIFNGTFYQNEIFDKVLYASPLTYCMVYFERSNFNTETAYEIMPGMGAKAVGLLVLLSLAASFLAYLLYQKRPSEAAGNAVIYAKIEPIIKWVAMYVVAIFTGSIMLDLVGRGFFIFAIIVFPILTHICAEVIFRKNFRALFGHWKCCLLFIIVFLAYTGSLYLDLWHFDSYLPDEDKIAAVAFNIDDARREMGSDYTDKAQIAAVYQLAQKIVHDELYYKNDNIYGNRYNNFYNSSTNTINIDIRYTLTNGKTVIRQYQQIPCNNIVQEYKGLYQQIPYEYDEWKSILLDTEKLRYVYINTLWPSEAAELDNSYCLMMKDSTKDAEEFTVLAEALLQDLAERTPAIFESKPLYQLDVNYSKSATNAWVYYKDITIYEDDKNALKVLNDFVEADVIAGNVTASEIAKTLDKIEIYQIDAAQIDNNGYIIYEDSERQYSRTIERTSLLDDESGLIAQGKATSILTFTDPADIERIMAQAVCSRQIAYASEFTFIDNRYFIVATFKGDAVNNSDTMDKYDTIDRDQSRLQTFYFLSSHLPSELQ